jgi:hypothetical protein
MNDSEESKGGAMELAAELLQTQEGSCFGDTVSNQLRDGRRMLEDGWVDLKLFRKRMHGLITEKLKTTAVETDKWMFEDKSCTTK